MQSQAGMLARHAVPVAYENKQAKLDLIGKWPAELRQIKADIASGTYHQRRYNRILIMRWSVSRQAH